MFGWFKNAKRDKRDARDWRAIQRWAENHKEHHPDDKYEMILMGDYYWRVNAIDKDGNWKASIAIPTDFGYQQNPPSGSVLGFLGL